MFKRRYARLWLSAAVIVVAPALADAATLTASSCSLAAVQAVVDSAANGDVVQVPAGACTWSSALVVSKSITLQGAGIDQTTITSASSGQVTLASSADNVRITAFTFAGGATLQVSGGVDWRVHHMKFVGPSFFEGVQIRGDSKTTLPRGLVDHCTFVNGRVLVMGYPGVGPSETYGATHWTQPLDLGTDKAVYVEDSTFTLTVFGNAMDCNYSGQYVFRHNTVTDAYIEAHSLQGYDRACRKWEIYDNTIRQSTQVVYRPFFIRGGTGVIFNNTVTGTFGTTTIHFDSYRSYADAGAPVGRCNGASTWDGNAQPNGYPCRDQIGRSTDAYAWTAEPYPSQTLDPAYVWNNTMNGSLMSAEVVNSSAGWVQANRDFYANVGPKPGYTPYTYPHPLVTLTAPAPPANVIIKK